MELKNNVEKIRDVSQVIMYAVIITGIWLLNPLEGRLNCREDENANFPRVQTRRISSDGVVYNACDGS